MATFTGTPAQLSIANRALEEIGIQAQITAAPPTDNSPAAQAIAVLYEPAVEQTIRQSNWDLARVTNALVVSGVAAPSPWNFSYLYPTDCIQLRYILPTAFSLLDPQPVRWAIGEETISSVVTKCIFTNAEDGSAAVYSTSPPESTWDAIFQEAVVRTLAAPLGMALAGRPDFSKALLEAAAMITQMGEGRDG